MDNRIDLLTQAVGRERIKFDEELTYHLYTKLSAKAPVFYVATNYRELLKILQTVHELKLPCTVFGNGSKISIPRGGFVGVLIKNRTNTIRIVGIKGKMRGQGIGVDEVLAEVDSGVSIQKLNEFLKHQGLLLDAHTSPPEASVGGALFRDRILRSRAETLTIWFEGEEMKISPVELKRDHIVLQVVFKFKGA